MKSTNELLKLIQKEDKIITVSHAREVGGCIPGWKAFCATHGFVWKDVVKNGLMASQLVSTDDVTAIKIVRYVYARR